MLGSIYCRDDDTLGPVELIVCLEKCNQIDQGDQCEQDDQGEVSIIIIGMSESFHNFKNIAYVGCFRHFVCVFVFVISFVFVFVSFQ